MEALQVAPAGASSDTLLHLLLRAHRRNEGLLLVELEGDTAAQLRALKQQHRVAALQETGAALQIAPQTAPAAATALHKLARRLTKAHMLRLGENPYLLHPHLDSLHDWMHPSRGGSPRVHSRLLVSSADRVGHHIDRGLFNIVAGTAADLAPIHLHLERGTVAGFGGGPVRLGALLPSDAGPDEMFGLVVPGYTLQCLDVLTEAVSHSVIPSRDDSSKRSTVVLQWRVSPDYVIDGWSVGDLLSGFDSVRLQRDQAQQAQQVQQANDAVPPTLPPLEGFVIDVRTLSGTQHQITAHPDWLVQHLKWAIQQATGQPAHAQKIVYGGRQLADGRTLEESGLQPGMEVHVVYRLVGD